MNRLEFMRQLEALLSDISQSEREEALQYYNDYLNDAGVENEQEVLEAMGTPEQLAKVIKEGLKDNGLGGEFTETGYYNEVYEEEKNEVVQKDAGNGQNKKRASGGTIVLLVILCILGMPMFGAMLSGIFGAGIGILGGLLGLFIGSAAIAFALFIAALLVAGIGIGEMFAVPLAGVCLIGAGILLAGLSLFFIWLTVLLWGTVFPWLIRTIVNFFGRILHGKRGGEGA